MNDYTLALAGLVALLVSGFVMYRYVVATMVGDNKVPLTSNRFIVAAIGMYVVAYGFVWLYNNTSFPSAAEGATKGFYLGLLIGIIGFAIPFYADAGYLKGKDNVMWAVLANWVVSFAVMGLVIGWLVAR